MSVVRLRLRLHVSTVTVNGSTKVAVTATIRRVIDMSFEVWFTKPEFGDTKLFLMWGLSEKQANTLVASLGGEFPECNFWVE
jgi:hypothetical protein